MPNAIMPGGGGGTVYGSDARTGTSGGGATHDAEHRRLRAHAHTRGSHRHVPCGSNIPNPPIVYYFAIPDTDNNTRNNKWSIVVKWYAVTEAQNGDDVDVDHYVVRLIGYKPDGTTEVYRKAFVVKGSDSAGNDPALEFRHDAILKRNRRYTVQVRAHTTQKCPGSWSTASSLIRVGGTTLPNALGTTPTNTAPDDRRVDFDWPDSTDPEFDRYKVEVYYGGTGGTASWSGTPTKTAYTRQSFYRYAVPVGERGGWFRARIYVQSEPDDDGARTDSTASSYSSGVKATEPTAATPANGSITAAMLATDAAIGNITDASIANSKLISVGLGKLQQGGASNGQVLAWNGTTWNPTTPSSGSSNVSSLNKSLTVSGVTATYTATPIYGKAYKSDGITVTGNSTLGSSNAYFFQLSGASRAVWYMKWIAP